MKYQESRAEEKFMPFYEQMRPEGVEKHWRKKCHFDRWKAHWGYKFRLRLFSVVQFCGDRCLMLTLLKIEV